MKEKRIKDKIPIYKRVWFWIVIILVTILLFVGFYILAVLNLEPIGGIVCPSIYGEILKETNIEVTTEEQAKEILFDYYKEIGRTINSEVNMIYTYEELPNVKGWVSSHDDFLISTKGDIYSITKCE